MDSSAPDEWLTLRHEAELEFERAKESACLGDAQSAVTARVEEFLRASDFQGAESQSVLDALSDLRVVTLEQDRYTAEQKCRALDRALDALRVVKEGTRRAAA